MSSPDLTPTQHRFIDILWDTGGVQLGEFTNFKHHSKDPKAKPAPYKISMRLLAMKGESEHQKYQNLDTLLTSGAEVLFEYLQTFKLKSADEIIGFPRVGQKLVLILFPMVNMHPVFIEKEGKGDNRHLAETITNIENPFTEKLIAIDDLINHGETFLEFNDVLIKHNQKPRELKNHGFLTLQQGLTIIDRQEGGIERLAQKRVTVDACIPMSAVYQRGLDRELITASKFEQLVEYQINQREKMLKTLIH